MDRTCELRLPFGGSSLGSVLGKVTGSGVDTGVIGTLEREDGCYEPHLMEFLSRATRSADICIDVGANIGIMTLCLARLCPEGRVYALEPGRASFEYLQRNIAENALANVWAEAVGAYDRNGSVELQLVDSHPGGAFLAETTVTGPASESIPVVRLDDWFDEHALPRVDVVKIDIEGAELRALTGAHRILERFRPLVVVECNPIALRRFQGVGTGDLLAALRSIYDTVYFLHQATPRPVDSTAQLRRQLEADGIVELVCGERVRPLARMSPRPRIAFRAARRVKDRVWKRGNAPAMNYVHDPSYDTRLDVEALAAPHGSVITVPMHVRNTCRRSWFSSQFPRNPVFASYHWLDADGRTIEHDGVRTAFAQPLAPRKQTTLSLVVRMPDQPGEYVLACALVQEGFAWFDELRPELVSRVAARAT